MTASYKQKRIQAATTYLLVKLTEAVYRCTRKSSEARPHKDASEAMAIPITSAGQQSKSHRPRRRRSLVKPLMIDIIN